MVKQFRSFFILLLLAISFPCVYTQANDACTLNISILTCSPGKELYSTFGHSAIRLTDKYRNIDIVYNYGTFDFNDTGFYMKFIRGQLSYSLSVENYTDFLESYKQEKRSVYEQVLDLNCFQKQGLEKALEQNMLAENRYYRYNFITDNCTTRIRDLLLNTIASVAIGKKIIPINTTPRKMIHSYLRKGGKLWSELGIDILLGSTIDRALSTQEAMFLPEYLMKGVDSMTKGDTKPLVYQKSILMQQIQLPNTSRINMPLLIFSIISCALGIIYFFYKNWSKDSVLLFFDIFLLSITGLTGILLCFMWWGTDHVACSKNYNLFWALPFNLVAAFFVSNPPKWLKVYFIVTGFITGFLLLFWNWLPQQLNIALVPLLVLLLIRYILLAVEKK